jgi:transcriptional regulator with XRE-family HTH domain
VNRLATLGSIIKRLRENRQYTQSKLGEKLGVAESTVSLYEADKREPDVATINRLADLFDVSTDYLLGRTEDRPAPDADLPPEALDKIEEFKELMRLKYGKDKK